MNFQKNKINIFVVCFYFASKGGNGAAEVTLGLFNSINDNKKLFEINDTKIKNIFLNFIFKIKNIFAFIFKIKKIIRNYNKNVIIIEGASWIGYSFIFFLLGKFFFKKSIFIYHSHNIEYDIRIKNKSNKFIIFLSKYFEKFLFRYCNYSTVVSLNDKKRIKKLYKENPYVLENGVDIKRLKIQKPIFKVPKKYFMFIGSYWFNPNKEAIDEILDKLYPIIIKIYPNINFIITGSGFPLEKLKNKNIKYFKNIKKNNLNFLIKNAEFLLFPMKKATGTKIKIIESLILGGKIITTIHGVKGINLISESIPIIYRENYELKKIIKNKIYKKKYSKNSKRIMLYYKKKYYMKFIFNNFLKKINLNE